MGPGKRWGPFFCLWQTVSIDMDFVKYSHRFADIILNSDYDLKKEVDRVLSDISQNDIDNEFVALNEERASNGKVLAKGKQSTINSILKREFMKLGWESEKNVFDDSSGDLAMDFWKRNVGVDVAFNHRSFIGGDLLRFQAAAEVTGLIKVGIYICPTKAFAKEVSPRDGSSMVVLERTQWYLEKFRQVITVPIQVIGLSG